MIDLLSIVSQVILRKLNTCNVRLFNFNCARETQVVIFTQKNTHCDVGVCQMCPPKQVSQPIQAG